MGKTQERDKGRRGIKGRNSMGRREEDLGERREGGSKEVE